MSVSYTHLDVYKRQVISTTGFATADFNLWPEFSRMILVLLMFVGACAGSTGGGFKVSRLIIMVKSVRNEIMSVTHPRSVQKVHMDGRRIPDNVVKTVSVSYTHLKACKPDYYGNQGNCLWKPRAEYF